MKRWRPPVTNPNFFSSIGGEEKFYNVTEGGSPFACSDFTKVTLADCGLRPTDSMSFMGDFVLEFDNKGTLTKDSYFHALSSIVSHWPFPVIALLITESRHAYAAYMDLNRQIHLMEKEELLFPREIYEIYDMADAVQIGIFIPSKDGARKYTLISHSSLELPEKENRRNRDRRRGTAENAGRSMGCRI